MVVNTGLASRGHPAIRGDSAAQADLQRSFDKDVGIGANVRRSCDEQAGFRRPPLAAASYCLCALQSCTVDWDRFGCCHAAAALLQASTDGAQMRRRRANSKHSCRRYFFLELNLDIFGRAACCLLGWWLEACVSLWEEELCRVVGEGGGMNGKRRGLGGGGDA